MDELMGLLDAKFLGLLAPLCLVAVRLLRTIAWIDQRPQLLPWASMLVGLALSVVLPLTGRVAGPGSGLAGYWIVDALLHGAAAGLIASGMYSAGARTLMPATPEQRKE